MYSLYIYSYKSTTVIHVILIIKIIIYMCRIKHIKRIHVTYINLIRLLYLTLHLSIYVVVISCVRNPTSYFSSIATCTADLAGAVPGAGTGNKDKTASCPLIVLLYIISIIITILIYMIIFIILVKYFYNSTVM